jgi:hypothetical protein
MVDCVELSISHFNVDNNSKKGENIFLRPVWIKLNFKMNFNENDDVTLVFWRVISFYFFLIMDGANRNDGKGGVKGRCQIPFKTNLKFPSIL